MGSYLTIVNDTEHTWKCKVGPDTKLLMISAWVVASIGLITAAIATAGWAAPVLLPVISGSTVTLYGVPTAALAAAEATGLGFGTASVALTGSIFTVIMTKVLDDFLEGKHYDELLPNQTKRYGKMSLSLWRQSECKKIMYFNSTIEVSTLYMRPIFSGATIDSNRNHSIQWWLDHQGARKEMIQPSTTFPHRHLIQKTM